MFSSDGLVPKLCQTVMPAWPTACQAPLSMGFPRQEYRSDLPFPSPGDLPNSGIETTSPILQDSLLLSHQGSPTFSRLGVLNALNQPRTFST